MRKNELYSNLIRHLEEIANAVAQLLKEALSRQDLSDSRLYQSVSGDADGELIKVLANDYIEYINRGRRPGSWPPINVIAKWCQSKGIPSDNRTVYLISRAIYLKGIKARPVLDNFMDEIDKYFDGWADEIAEIVFKEIDNIITSIK